jgi:uncharacterized protein (TIGR03435 family)
MTVAAPIALSLLNTTDVLAQAMSQSNSTNGPVYEVASIKPDEKADGTERVTFRYTPDGLIAKNMSLQLLIRTAYGVYDSQIIGAPNWLDAREYDIEAKMDESEADKLQSLSTDQAKLERQHLLQALLAERFKLALHHETREGPMFALVVAKNGPKFQESSAAADAPARPKLVEENGKLIFHGAPMAPLATMLSQVLGRPVLDRTGLSAKYDFALQWTPDEFNLPESDASGSAQQANDAASPLGSTAASIFTAIQDDLGLKLESIRGPVDVIVIDHVEMPTAN